MTSNRTILELKLLTYGAIGIVGLASNRTILELKHGYMFFGRQNYTASNRTILELKLILKNKFMKLLSASNRTILELKHQRYRELTHGAPVI